MNPHDASLSSFPPFERWDDWREWDSSAWPRRVERRYRLVPTTCFNCEAACGLVAYVDRDEGRIRRLEGNPYHPGSRGRNCAKGPATLNQIEDPERILTPMLRTGPRGSGRFAPCTWEEALARLAEPIRKAIREGRLTEVIYHVGRPGHDGAMDRVLRAWGVDGHNSHTNVCSAAARLGYALWSGSDRPSPDYARANTILLVSSHLETGHYFNPHAQRIVEAKERGARLIVIDVRLSNTASAADVWLSPWPGTEAELLCAIARHLLVTGAIDRDYLRDFVNWREFLRARHPEGPQTFEAFLDRLAREYEEFTFERVAERCRVPPEDLERAARFVAESGGRLAGHVWRSAASGNQGGWQVARCLQLLAVLTGGVGVEGGTNLASWDKFVPAPFAQPPPQRVWNELLYPREWPLAHHEMSFLLPHLLKERGARLAAYFTRVYNPVWTNPDGAAWMEMLEDEERVGIHAALTPTWNETALFADLVLPMGHSPERHDLQSQETHSARWIAFRQPVLRALAELEGRRVDTTRETNPGDVWEEDEFWIELSWTIDPDGSLGVRKWFESPYRPGEKLAVPEYYRWIFENSVPGLPEEASRHGMSPLEYMRRFGAFLVEEDTWRRHERELKREVVAAAKIDEEQGAIERDGRRIGLYVRGRPVEGFATPSRRLEWWSPTLEEWGWPEHAIPKPIESHVHWSRLDPAKGEMVLVPTFRLPVHIHTRSANAKWLVELAHSNPLWLHPEDARRVGVATGDLVRVTTRLGHFVNRAYVTEAIRPGVAGCSHHLGRWRQEGGEGTNRLAAATVKRERLPDGRLRLRRTADVGPFETQDPDTTRMFWRDGGVHQNLTFGVQPDPVSGMHCWHQIVVVEKARSEDRYGDVVVDPARSMEIYREWKAKTRPAPGPSGLRRPLHFARAVRPADEAYFLPPEGARG